MRNHTLAERAAWRDTLATILLGIAAVVAPLALGCTGTVGDCALLLAMWCAVLAWGGRNLPSNRWVIPIVVVAALGFLQAMLLPRGVVTLISSLSDARWLDHGAGAGRSLSVEPALTRLATLRAVLAGATILATATLALNPVRWRWLAGAVAASGVIIWTLGLMVPVQREGGRILLGFVDLAGPVDWWLTPYKEPRETAAFGYPAAVDAVGQRFTIIDWVIGDGFGPYVISNHFAAGIYFTIPLAIAWWLWATRGRLHTALRFAVAAAAMVAAVWTVGICAESRAGGAAVLLSCLVLTWLVVEGPIARWIAGIAAGGFATLLFLFTAMLYGRLSGIATLFPAGLQPRVAKLMADPRAIATDTAWRLFLEAPVFGTGLGTYGDSAARFSGANSPWYYAHNEYAQLLAETGVVGTMLALALGWWFARGFVRFCRESGPPERILGAGAWAAMGGILAHSAFDWNLYVPANALLTCIVAGLAVATVPNVPGGRSPDLLDRPRVALMIRWAACIAVLLCLPWLLRDACSDIACRRLREAITSYRLCVKDAGRPPPWDALENAYAGGAQMGAWDPANAKLAQLVAQSSLLLATQPQPIDEVDRWMTTADEWFRRARRHSIVCTGLPAPISASNP